MSYRTILPLFCVSLALSSCVTRKHISDATPETLDTMKTYSSEKVKSGKEDFQLAWPKSKGITHTVWRDVVNPKLNTQSQATIRVVFEKLTQAQYQLLMVRYGGQNLVPYQANRSYELVDFLPPKMQALVNHWLVSTSQPDTRIPKEWGTPYNPGAIVYSNVGMNCWAIAYEVLRDLGKSSTSMTGKFFYFGPKEAEKLLWTNQALQSETAGKTELARNLWPQEKTSERNKGRQLGDALYIKTKYSYFGPAHIALWVDDDLYFEKTNYSSDDPIRLAFYSDVISPYLEQDEPEKPMKMTFIRYKPATQVAFPEPESFAGQWPWGNERDGVALPPLPSEIKNSMIFTLDGGMGGSLKELSANRILKFPLAQDPKTQRATYSGATELKNFLLNDALCAPDERAASNNTYRYKITGSLQLYVMSQAGKEVARLNGTKVDRTEGDNKILIDFHSSNKVLSLYRGKYGSLALKHPGVHDEIDITCSRDYF